MGTFDISQVRVDTSQLAKLGIGLQANFFIFENLTLTEIAQQPITPYLLRSDSPKLTPLIEIFHAAFGENTPPEVFGEIMTSHVDHRDKHMEQPIEFAVLTLILLLIVGARIWSRLIYSTRLWASDWLIIAGTILTLGYEAIMIAVIVRGGAGHHMWDVTYDQIKFNLKFSYVCAIYYCFNLTPIKLSLLFFYHSISPKVGYRITIWVTGAIIVTSNIIFIFINVWVCTPLNWFDHPADNIKCLHKIELFRAQAIMSFLTDVALVIIPITVVMKLKMGRREKYIVLFLFILGGLGSVTSIIRMMTIVDFVENADYTWIEGSTALWTIIESQIGIICASVPALKALISRYIPHFLRSRTGTHSSIFRRSSRRTSTYPNGVSKVGGGVGPHSLTTSQLQSPAPAKLGREVDVDSVSEYTSSDGNMYNSLQYGSKERIREVEDGGSSYPRRNFELRDVGGLAGTGEPNVRWV